jgi:peptidoglycan-associated lipoprotein
VYFDFDRSLLSDAARSTLEASARCLRSASVRVVVEGNCDERGTADYNLHLGQRRADAVKRYLRHLGVRPSRITTVSFGEERPLCTEPTEPCWQRNRRADVKIHPPP